MSIIRLRSLLPVLAALAFGCGQPPATTVPAPLADVVQDAVPADEAAPDVAPGPAAEQAAGYELLAKGGRGGG
ncbi:MAG: hypothetical protein JWM80_1248, partial [Cyanobacteria bacterium RYN_339]|nr:hypothetical protein [Cyanobacteria bacterium RYN_339]